MVRIFLEISQMFGDGITHADIIQGQSQCVIIYRHREQFIGQRIPHHISCPLQQYTGLTSPSW